MAVTIIEVAKFLELKVGRSVLMEEEIVKMVAPEKITAIGNNAMVAAQGGSS
jgi:hypothetical protein